VTAHKPKHRRPGMFSVLREQYGLLWAGQTVSLIGDSVFLVAFTWQVAVEWKRPALLAAAIGFSVPALYRWRPFPDDFADLPPVTTPTSAPPPTLTIPPLPRTAGAERSESRARP
jgi:hypothetical protein